MRAGAGPGIPVYDNTNFFQNLITAAQSTLTAIATAETAANTILDLTPLDEIVTASGMIEDLAALAEIMAQVDVLSTDIASLQAQVAVLFGLDTAPASTSELQVRLRESAACGRRRTSMPCGSRPSCGRRSAPSSTSAPWLRRFRASLATSKARKPLSR